MQKMRWDKDEKRKCQRVWKQGWRERVAEQRSYLFLASAGVPHGEGSEVSWVRQGGTCSARLHGRPHTHACASIARADTRTCSRADGPGRGRAARQRHRLGEGKRRRKEGKEAVSEELKGVTGSKLQLELMHDASQRCVSPGQRMCVLKEENQRQIFGARGEIVSVWRPTGGANMHWEGNGERGKLQWFSFGFFTDNVYMLIFFLIHETKHNDILSGLTSGIQALASDTHTDFLHLFKYSLLLTGIPKIWAKVKCKCGP